MKTKLTIIAFFVALASIAQNGINYKALIKDTNGNILNTQGIDMVFSIQYEGNTLYSELQQIVTDNNGIAIATIGEGSSITGVFDTITWDIGNLDLNVQIDFGDGLVDFGNSGFNLVPYAIEVLNKEGLISINEGAGTGWRLEGVVTDGDEGYGSIGNNATDLSVSNANGLNLIYPYGATGTGSFATGRNTVAFGDYSTALGHGTIASENYTTTMGFLTQASGLYATAMGRSTNANAIYSTAIGRYNLGGGNATVWNDNDPLFEIGNGSSASNRSNALTVFKSGAQALRSNNYGLNIRTGDDSNDYGIEIVGSGGDGLIITSAGNDGIVVNGAIDDGLVIFANDQGARISGDNAGIYASGGSVATQGDIPDIILGSIGPDILNDDGIISTNPIRTSSDMILQSYDDVVVQLDFDSSESGTFRIQNDAGTNVVSINEFGDLDIDGRLQIGNETIEDTGSNQLSVDASLIPNTNNAFRLGNSDNRWIGVWATDGTINTSDRREKKNIKVLNYGLNEILQMNPVSFKWKNRRDQDTKLGLIAQDLLELVPEVVKSYTWEKDELSGELTKKELKRLGVYYSDLVPILIKAIQEQQKIITTQRDENLKQTAELSGINDTLKTLLSRIEKLENNQSN
ncbi:tail fiber domain-containing protein [uncultured Psychroserpens sp.]|uniref:tail fiber domain-containing protein n=1 Tax=uncultured Psychroserpens sp. TaxID=255436 RepID=UPI002620663F|nr:tail fiber domain-containing protein [uncultured Psychroserpens sp.]